MSFSGEVKEELAGRIPTARHCQIAELAALVGMCGSVCITARNTFRLRIHTENISVARKCFTLFQKAFNICSDVSVRVRKNTSGRSRIFTLWVKKHEDTLRVLEALGLFGDDGEIEDGFAAAEKQLLERSCCRRAFLRGAFLASGSMTEPLKSYHFEIVCNSKERAEQIRALIAPFGPEAKIVQRRKYDVVYVKEGAQIVDMLNIMEAHNSLMNLENIRIVREVRNSVNRKVNCEAANINKTVNAAVRQLEDIRYLAKVPGLDRLPEGLAEIARLRLDNPDATLKELGQMLDPPVGKSGVNHRLRKLSLLAQDYGQFKEEYQYD